MKHISYSSLKDWDFCPWFHKLTKIDKVGGFEGNEHTAFGKAIHTICEGVVGRTLIEPTSEFLSLFDDELNSLSFDKEQKIITDMKVQGLNIIPQIEPALQDYFSSRFFQISNRFSLMSGPSRRSS